MNALPKHMRYVTQGAHISACGRYRYLLWREWRDDQHKHWNQWGGPDCVDDNGHVLEDPWSCLFIMLNPSTADSEMDDPTIRRCVGFARREGYERLEVVNLFAHRATSPKELLDLKHTDDPVGERNLMTVERAVERAKLIICAWGSHGGHLGQDETMLGWIGDRKVHCLGRTAEGKPRHPLYLKSDAKLEVFK